MDGEPLLFFFLQSLFAFLAEAVVFPFAPGLRAAQWLVQQKPGLYDMQDVLGLK